MLARRRRTLYRRRLDRGGRAGGRGAGFRVGASQTVSLLPGARLETLRPVTILVHKPVGVYANDEPGSACDLIVPANRMEGDRRRSATPSACWPDCDW